MIPQLPSDLLWESLRRMLLIRRFEETCGAIVHEPYFPGNHTHLYIGQEATGVGVAMAIAAEDLVFSTHRNHGHVLSRGADPGRAMAEILGKTTGYCRGRAGTLHGCAPELNIPYSSAVVGGTLPITVGAALAAKHQGLSRASVMMFGDGVLEEGVFYESINLASLWGLPVVLVCENNAWPKDEIQTPEPEGRTSLATRQLVDAAAAFGIPTMTIDGADLGAVYDAADAARRRAASGGGPTFIEARTRGWPGDTGETGVPWAWEGAPTPWGRRDDPVLRLVTEMEQSGLASRERLQALDAEVSQTMASALQFAMDSPYPPAEEAYANVWP